MWESCMGGVVCGGGGVVCVGRGLCVVEDCMWGRLYVERVVCGGGLCVGGR